jgi:hypothetical protein
MISKSRYLNGLQCLKLLWLIFNDSDKVPVPDAASQRIFDQGHEVGELAKKLYPDGINIPDSDFMANLNLTRQYLEYRRPLFEAGIMSDGLFCRPDILNPAENGAWDIIEVKSTTSIKEVNYHDVSFQRYCCEKAGLKINRCYLAVINNRYVKWGKIDPKGFFSINDITAEVKEAVCGIEDRISVMKKTIASPVCPEPGVGGHCRDPYDCPVKVCWEGILENNIFELYRGGKKCFQLFNEGILKLSDIPDGFKLNRSQQIQKICDVNGDVHIEKDQIKDFLDKIESPVHYLDFETISPAVPLFDGTRPYQRIPFQYSLHVVDKDSVRHYSFLAEGKDDPRPELLRRLNNELGTVGTIITYNQSFEEGLLREMAVDFPEYADWAVGICSRMLDLLVPFRSFHYYHPEQHGSASIKSVMPAVTGKGYDGLTIAKGDEASAAFLEVTFGEAREEERSRVRFDLEKYCGLDTEGMIWIVDELKRLCSS